MLLTSLTFNVTALISGLLFGAGMMLSGMVDPARVLGFLDIAGAWDPSLAFVMGGGLLVFMPSYYFFIRGKNKPVCANDFKVSTKKNIDKPLIIGAILFGIGWGLAGICPGPALTALGSFDPSIFLFVASMTVGNVLADYLSKNK